MNIAIITGASSGIGKEFARQLDNGFSTIDELWLVARRESALNELAASLHHKTRIFSMDITRPDQIERLVYSVRLEKARVCLLINCAGYGIIGEFAKADPKDTIGMVRVNCEALTAVTHRLIPYMRRGSRIIQLASSAAFVPQSHFAVYAATKSYVLSLSRALHQELKKYGISVTAVCPGPVDTPFFDIAQKNGGTLKIKELTMVTPGKVVEQALKDAYFKRPLSVCSLPIKGFEVLTKAIPHGIIIKIVGLMYEREDR